MKKRVKVFSAGGATVREGTPIRRNMVHGFHGSLSNIIFLLQPKNAEYNADYKSCMATIFGFESEMLENIVGIGENANHLH